MHAEVFRTLRLTGCSRSASGQQIGWHPTQGPWVRPPYAQCIRPMLLMSAAEVTPPTGSCCMPRDGAMQRQAFPVKVSDARTSCGTLEQHTRTRSGWRSGPMPSRTGVYHRCTLPQTPRSTMRMAQRPFLTVTLPGLLSLLLMESHLSVPSV